MDLNKRIPEAIQIFHNATGVSVEKIKEVTDKVDEKGGLTSEEWCRLSDFGIKMHLEFDRKKMMEGCVSVDEFKYRLIKLAAKTSNNFK